MASTNLSYTYENSSKDVWSFSCSVSEVSANENYRVVSLRIAVRTTDFSAGRNGSYSISCDEADYDYSESCAMPGSSQDRLVIFDEEFEVYVAPGKNYADINLEFKVDFTSPSTGKTVSASGGITRITGLSVVSDVKIKSASNVYFGDNCSVTWFPPSASFHYRLKFDFGEDSYTTDLIHPDTTSSYTYSDYIIPESAASVIPNSEYGTVTVSLYQYSDSSGTELVGTVSTATFRVTLKDDVVPTIASYSAQIDNSGNEAINSWGVAVAGYSKVNLKATASGVYGSEIRSFTISNNYYTTVYESSLDYTGDIIKTSGQKSFVISCTDSRGRVSESVTTDLISFLSYTAPKVKKLSMSKETNDDSDTSNDRMVATATWEFDSVNGNNSATAQIQYKKSTDADSDWVTHSGNLTNGDPFTLSNLSLDEEISYNFKVVVTDAIGNKSEKEAFMSTTTVLLDFKAGGDGFGIGKICEEPGLEVSMPATFFNEVYIGKRDKTLADYIQEQQKQPLTSSYVVDLIYPVGSIYISATSTNPSVLFGGSWEQLKGRFLLGVGEAGANTDDRFGDMLTTDWSADLGSKGGQDYNTLTVEEIPDHSHFGVRRNATDNGGTHSVGSSAGDNSASARTDSEGGGQAHNNMPPYLAVYMWQRVS